MTPSKIVRLIFLLLVQTNFVFFPPFSIFLKRYNLVVSVGRCVVRGYTFVVLRWIWRVEIGLLSETISILTTYDVEYQQYTETSEGWYENYRYCSPASWHMMNRFVPFRILLKSHKTFSQITRDKCHKWG